MFNVYFISTKNKCHSHKYGHWLILCEICNTHARFQVIWPCEVNSLGDFSIKVMSSVEKKIAVCAMNLQL